MSAASNILKAFNLYVDGVGYAGQVDELQLPTLAIVEEDFRAGGMDAPIGVGMGMEKLEATFSLSGYEPAALARFGLAEGQQTQLTARGSLESLDGTKTPVVVNMRGTLKSVEPGAWQAGQKSAWSFTVSLRYYRFEQGGAAVHEIDVVNMVRLVNGVDQLAAERANIGI
jgi:P2 family phage contractile tail tube protein